MFFVWSQENTKLSIKDLLKKDDLILVNLPHLEENFSNWSQNIIFQHLIQFEGLSDVKKLYEEVGSEIDLVYDGSALVVMRSSGGVLLAIEVEEEENRLASFFSSNQIVEKQIDSTLWYIQQRGALLLASQQKELLSIEKDEGLAYSKYNFNHLFFEMNFQEMARYLKLPLDDSFFQTMNELSKNVNHSLTFNDYKISASGFDFDETKAMHKLLEGQEPQNFKLSPYILLDFQSVKSIQFENGETFVKQNSVDCAPEIFDDFGAAEVVFEAGKETNSKVLVLNSNDHNGLSALFNPKEFMSAYGFELSTVGDKEWLSKTFKNYFSIKPTFIAVREDVLVLAESQDALEAYLKKMSHNQVWYHSYEQMKWVENELIYNNSIYVVKLSAIVQSFGKVEKLKTYYDNNKDLFVGLPYLLVQQSKELNGIYEGITTVYDENTELETHATVEVGSAPETATFSEAETLVSFNSELVSKPIPVKDYTTGSLQFLLLDTNNVLRLVTNTGKEKWKFKLDGRLVSEISEIDVFKNKKLQYIFATDKKLYCIDRLGRMVEKFPIELPKNEAIQGFSLIDYNQSKNYRLALNSKRNVWLFDVKGKVLQGWNPMKFKSDLLGNVKHYRYQTKDYLLALEKDGTVNVLKRRGLSYSGFPQDLKMSLLTSDIYLDKNVNSSSSGFSFISDEGMVMKYGLNGSFITAEKLPVSEDMGKIFIESNQSKYRYVTTTDKELFVFDSKLSRRFSMDNEQELIGFQVYELSGQEIYVFIFNGSMSLISQKGEVILQDVPTSKEVTLYYSSKNRKGYIYYTSDDKLMKQMFLLSK